MWKTKKTRGKSKSWWSAKSIFPRWEPVFPPAVCRAIDLEEEQRNCQVRWCWLELVCRSRRKRREIASKSSYETTKKWVVHLVMLGWLWTNDGVEVLLGPQADLEQWRNALAPSGTRITSMWLIWFVLLYVFSCFPVFRRTTCRKFSKSGFVDYIGGARRWGGMRAARGYMLLYVTNEHENWHVFFFFLCVRCAIFLKNPIISS